MLSEVLLLEPDQSTLALKQVAGNLQTTTEAVWRPKTKNARVFGGTFAVFKAS